MPHKEDTKVQFLDNHIETIEEDVEGEDMATEFIGRQ